MMASISDVAILLRNGKAVQQSADAGGLPITRIETIADWAVNHEKVGFAGLCREDCEDWLLQNGDILISHINSTKHLGKCAMYEGVPSELVHGMNLLALRVDEGLADARFIYRMLASSGFRSQLPQITKDSVNQSSFNISNFKKLQIPLPPLAEQKRIAAILDAADALRAKRRESLAQLDTLLQSTFLDMFGDPVTNPKGWEYTPFNKIGTFVSGATPSKACEEYWIGSIPWVSPKDMKVSRIFDAQDHVNEKAFNETNLKLLQPNHLLVVVRGMILAHSFPVAINLVPIAINQDMKGICPSSKFDVCFLLECVRHLKRHILSEVSTAGHGTKRFDAEAMKKVFVPTPPLDLQRSFATIVESVEQQKGRLREHLAELDTLFASLQQRAFNGNL